MRRFGLLAIACAASFASVAQNNSFVSVAADRGYIPATNDFLNGENALGKRLDRCALAQLEYGWVADGSEDWHHVHNFPSFGVGVGTLWTDDKEEFGQPLSVFAFYKGVWARWGHSSISCNLETGLTFGWKEFDVVSNPYNITIGSPLTVHINFGVEYAYTLAGRWVLAAGAGATHFSNGAMVKPNKGLNILSPRLRVAYLLNPERIPERRVIPKQKGWELDFMLGHGVKEVDADPDLHDGVTSEYMDNKFHTTTLVATLMRRYSNKGKYGLGISTSLDDYVGADWHGDGQGNVSVDLASSSDRMTVGVVAAHEVCISRISIPMQLGYYLRRKSAAWQKEQHLFQRAGLKYTMPCNVTAGVNIYAHSFSKADFIEWNIGYSLPLFNKRVANGVSD